MQLPTSVVTLPVKGAGGVAFEKFTAVPTAIPGTHSGGVFSLYITVCVTPVGVVAFAASSATVSGIISVSGLVCGSMGLTDATPVILTIAPLVSRVITSFLGLVRSSK